MLCMPGGFQTGRTASLQDSRQGTAYQQLCCRDLLTQDSSKHDCKSAYQFKRKRKDDNFRRELNGKPSVISGCPEAYPVPHQLQGPSKGRGAAWCAPRHSASAAAWHSARPAMRCPSSLEGPTHQNVAPSVQQCFQFNVLQDAQW